METVTYSRVFPTRYGNKRIFTLCSVKIRLVYSTSLSSESDQTYQIFSLLFSSVSVEKSRTVGHGTFPLSMHPISAYQTPPRWCETNIAYLRAEFWRWIPLDSTTMASANVGKLSILPPPATQGLNSTTFSPPPLDGSLTIPELVEWHYKRSANHPVFIYDDDGSTKTIHWKDLYPAIHRAGRYVRKVFGFASPETPSDRPVIAILANVGELFFAISYHVIL